MIDLYNTKEERKMKEIFLFNEGWKFKKECEIFSAVTDDYFDMYRSNTKTGIMSGPKIIAFYDEDWKIVNLPHDWVIEEKPEKNILLLRETDRRELYGIENIFD